MKIALASDHAGFDLKTAVAAELARRGLEIVDFGTGAGESADYPLCAAAAAEALSRGECDLGILICGTGLGMAIAANKFKGVRATPCWNAYTADMSRRHNDANCLTLGGRTHAVEQAMEVVRVWLDTPFEGGRHARRVDQIREIEARNFK